MKRTAGVLERGVRIQMALLMWRRGLREELEAVQGHQLRHAL